MIIIFEIKYVSKGGTICIGGGDHPLINAVSIEGLGIPDPQYNNITYINQPGQVTAGQQDLPRAITISGDLNGGQREIEQFYNALYYDGELYLTFGRQRRKIACRIGTVDNIVRHPECDISSFTVQFIADYPYFTDFYPTKKNIFDKVNLLPNLYENGEWKVQLPAIATDLKTETQIYLYGDREIYPIIYILNQGTESSVLSHQGLTIELFDTTDVCKACIDLSVSTLDNELITIDLPCREITSNLHGSLTGNISDNTVLSDFKFDLGFNLIRVTNKNTSEKITAWVEFSPEYLTAVY